MSEGTRVYQQGKATIFEYPPVYERFVRTLYEQHDDLVRAMALSELKLEDGSALDFLNLMLGTNITRFTPMEIGYAQLLDALNMRVRSPISERGAEELAKSWKDYELSPKQFLSEDVQEKMEGKPVFPSWDDVEEQNKRKKKEEGKK